MSNHDLLADDPEHAPPTMAEAFLLARYDCDWDRLAEMVSAATWQSDMTALEKTGITRDVHVLQFEDSSQALVLPDFGDSLPNLNWGAALIGISAEEIAEEHDDVLAVYPSWTEAEEAFVRMHLDEDYPSLEATFRLPKQLGDILPHLPGEMAGALLKAAPDRGMLTKLAQPMLVSDRDEVRQAALQHIGSNRQEQPAPLRKRSAHRRDG